MKTIKIRKRNRISKMKSAIKNNLQLIRFIRDIEREEFLDTDSLRTIVALK
jgi:hypothetical protein